jgi:arginase
LIEKVYNGWRQVPLFKGEERKTVNIHIIGVPSDLGASKRGSDMGPNAIRYAGLEERLRELGHTVVDEGNLPVPLRETPPFSNPKLKNLESILTVCETLATRVEHVYAAGGFPLIIGGDHSLTLGSATGAARARGSIGVLWVDAHGDFNTDETSPSGNIHGMPLAALVGRGDKRLVELGDFSPKVDPAHIAIIGAHDIDATERALLRQACIHVFTMKEIDREGMRAIMAQALEITASGTNGLHVSFDMDAVDPNIAPGVGTRVTGGLTYREAHLLMELIYDSGKMTSLDLVEVNPILDHENHTANLAVEFALSAFGKSIL